MFDGSFFISCLNYHKISLRIPLFPISSHCIAHYMTSMSQYIPTISHLPTIVDLDTLSMKVILIINPSSWSYP